MNNNDQLGLQEIHDPDTFGYKFVLLPDDAFRACCERMSISDLIAVSIFEANARDRIQGLQLKKMRIDVVLGDGEVIIILRQKEKRGELYIAKSDPRLSGNRRVTGRVGAEQNVECYSSYGKFVSAYNREKVQNIHTSDHPFFAVKDFVEHLQSVFYATLDTVRMGQNYADNLGHFSEALLQCQKLEIRGELPHELFTRFVRDFNAQHVISRYHAVTRNETPLGMEINKDTYEFGGDRLRICDLHLLNCRIIAFTCSYFKSPDYNQIVKNWKEGQYPRWEHVVDWVCKWDITLSEDSFRHVDPAVVLNHIEHSAVTETNVPTIREHIGNSVKITGTDGRTAVVTMDGKQNGRSFHFRLIVFKDENDQPDCSCTYRKIENNWMPNALLY